MSRKKNNAKMAYNKQQQKLRTRANKLKEKEAFVSEMNKTRTELNLSPINTNVTKVSAQDIQAMRESNYSGRAFAIGTQKREYIQALEGVVGYEVIVEEMPEYESLIDTIRGMSDDEFFVRWQSITDTEVANPIATFGSEGQRLYHKSDDERSEAKGILGMYIDDLADIWLEPLNEDQRKLLEQLQKAKEKPKNKSTTSAPALRKARRVSGVR